jgi:hypothetical protein
MILQPLPEEYLNEVIFALTVGEQAPFKSAADVDALTRSQRDFFLKKVGEMYQRQKQEMDRQAQKTRKRK